MKNRVMVLALIVSFGVLFALIMSTRAQDDDMTMTVVERATTDVVTDTGAEGDSVGDILTFANEVFDAENAEKVGTDNGYCVRTVVGAAWECNWTMMLAEGMITVEGPFNDSGDSIFVITGGTGKYVGAEGQMNLHPRNPEGTEYDFVYQLSEDDD
jgi:allene oxide cyclase